MVCDCFPKAQFNNNILKQVSQMGWKDPLEDLYSRVEKRIHVNKSRKQPNLNLILGEGKLLSPKRSTKDTSHVWQMNEVRQLMRGAQAESIVRSESSEYTTTGRKYDLQGFELHGSDTNKSPESISHQGVPQHEVVSTNRTLQSDDNFFPAVAEESAGDFHLESSLFREEEATVGADCLEMEEPYYQTSNTNQHTRVSREVEDPSDSVRYSISEEFGADVEGVDQRWHPTIEEVLKSESDVQKKSIVYEADAFELQTDDGHGNHPIASFESRVAANEADGSPRHPTEMILETDARTDMETLNCNIASRIGVANEEQRLLADISVSFEELHHLNNRKKTLQRDLRSPQFRELETRVEDMQRYVNIQNEEMMELESDLRNRVKKIAVTETRSEVANKTAEIKRKGEHTNLLYQIQCAEIRKGQLAQETEVHKIESDNKKKLLLSQRERLEKEKVRLKGSEDELKLAREKLKNTSKQRIAALEIQSKSESCTEQELNNKRAEKSRLARKISDAQFKKVQMAAELQNSSSITHSLSNSLLDATEDAHALQKEIHTLQSQNSDLVLDKNRFTDTHQSSPLFSLSQQKNSLLAEIETLKSFNPDSVIPDLDKKIRALGLELDELMVDLLTCCMERDEKLLETQRRKPTEECKESTVIREKWRKQEQKLKEEMTVLGDVMSVPANTSEDRVRQSKLIQLIVASKNRDISRYEQQLRELKRETLSLCTAKDTTAASGNVAERRLKKLTLKTQRDLSEYSNLCNKLKVNYESIDRMMSTKSTSFPHFKNICEQPLLSPRENKFPAPASGQLLSCQDYHKRLVRHSTAVTEVRSIGKVASSTAFGSGL